MELSPELLDLLRDNMFAPLRKALAEENILTVESFRTVRPWAFLNEHDLYPMADRQSISLRILKLRDDAIKTPAEEDLNDVPYAKRFSREPALYDAYPITDCGFSVRVLGRLLARGINSVGKLLEQTDSKLLAISGFGRNSINEVHDYLSKLEERSLSKVKTDIKVDATDEVLKYKDRIWAGDFSFVEADNLSTRSRLAVHTLENAYHVLGSDLVTAVREKPDYIKHLKKMLEGFITDVQIVSACEGIIQKIPTSRRDIDAKTVIKAYTANTETQSSLLVNYSEGASLRQFIFSNGEAIANQDAKLMRFLQLQEQKKGAEAGKKEIEEDMKRLKAAIIAKMGKSCKAICQQDGVNYTVTYNPIRTPGIDKDNLKRLKLDHPDIYEQYVTVSVSRRFVVKCDGEAA